MEVQDVKPSVDKVPLLNRLRQSSFWRSIFRQGYPFDDENRALIMFNSFFLHIHPVKVKKHTLKISYTWGLGVIATFLFAVLALTGGILIFFYVPSVNKAYLDMQFLATSVTFGMLLRNFHRWAAHLMVLVVFLHMCRVFFTAGYKSPREFNWVMGVLLWVFTLLFSFTGYLLPYDQLAYWAITIASNIASYMPLIGHQLQSFLIGGPTIGQDALQRFYSLHIFILPFFVTILIVIHFWRIRKDGGLSAPVEKPAKITAIPDTIVTTTVLEGIQPAKPNKTYGLMSLMKGTSPMVDKSPDDSVFSWPYLLVTELMAVLGSFIVLLFISFIANAPLRAMADPNVTEDPAKAPWFFSSLQEILLHMSPTLAGFFIPVIVILVLMAVPYFDRSQDDVGQWFASKKGKTICFWAGLYTAIVEIGLVLFDRFVPWQTVFGGSQLLLGWIVPIAVIIILIFILYLGLRQWHPNKREFALGFFVSFVVTYFVLMIITQFFRGSGMHLIPIWQLPPGGVTF